MKYRKARNSVHSPVRAGSKNLRGGHYFVLYGNYENIELKKENLLEVDSEESDSSDESDDIK